jgi:glycosyltransferase involved in cell wall biosynthesis
MRAKVIHIDLNPCGGAEHLALVTLKSLIKMGIKVDLAVAREPDVTRISKSFGEYVYEIFDNIHVSHLGRLPLETDRHTGEIGLRQVNKTDFEEYDMVINTHADILPFFVPSLKHYITYCHFPAAATHLRRYDASYLNNLLEMDLLDRELANDVSIWRVLLQYYFLMLKESQILTNSRFSQRAIIKELQQHFGNLRKVPTIVSPPACVDEIGKVMLSTASREDTVLVLSRIHQSKQIENAIKLARILVHRGIGKKMIIAGNLTSDVLCQKYYRHLLAMTESYGLSDYVSFLPSVHFRELRRLMQKSKAYFHPMQGEPFGISVVEAMAAGTVPVVPNVGGMIEFVPKEYQFRSIEEAADKIQSAMHAPDAERKRIRGLVKVFTSKKYEAQFTLFMNQNIPSSQEPNATLRLVPRPG